VPPSLSDGTIVHPAPQDQYPAIQATIGSRTGESGRLGRVPSALEHVDRSFASATQGFYATAGGAAGDGRDDAPHGIRHGGGRRESGQSDGDGALMLAGPARRAMSFSTPSTRRAQLGLVRRQ